MDREEDPDLGVSRVATDVSGGLLYVCMANVCRSPTMTHLTREQLSTLGLDGRWRISSAGASAPTGSRMCRAAARTIETSESGRRFVREHRSRPLSQELVDGAALILVATKRERSAVTRINPEARTKTFTILEGARLAEVAVQRDARPWSSSDDLDLGAFREVLHQLRGSLDDSDPSRSTRRRLLGRWRGHDPLDIGDVHAREVWSHAPVLESLEWASEAMGQSLGILAERAGVEPIGAAPDPS